MKQNFSRSGLSVAHEKTLRKIPSSQERSYYIHEAVRHTWSVRDLERAVQTNEFQKRKGLGLAPSLADAGRRGRALGCVHNTLQNSLRTSSQKSR